MESIKIIIPCYNEARRLTPLRFREFANRMPNVTFTFVNDGSRDDTLPLLQRLCADCPGSNVLDLPQNQGKAEAVRQGVLIAMAEQPTFVGYWDADLATPLDAIPTFADVFARTPGLELVMGSRVRLLGRRIERRWSRHLLGRVFATCASQVLGLPVYDTQCGAKLFRVTPITQAIFSKRFLSRWIFDVELLARFVVVKRLLQKALAEDAIYEVPLDVWRDIGGSKVRSRDFVKAVGELARIKLSLHQPDRFVTADELIEIRRRLDLPTDSPERKRAAA